MAKIEIRIADIDEIKPIVELMDKYLAGYGFVTSAQIKTEIKRNCVWVAIKNNKIVGVRIGSSTLYNLLVHPDYRKLGIGKALILVKPPRIIRVKAVPVGHLSNEQIKNFKNPEAFYSKCGYKFFHREYSRNFYSGSTKDGKRIYYKRNKKPHIKIYLPKNPKQKRIVEK